MKPISHFTKPVLAGLIFCSAIIGVQAASLPDFEKLAEDKSQTVVSVQTKAFASKFQRSNRNNPFGDFGLPFPFPDFGQRGQQPEGQNQDEEELAPLAGGSGVIISEDGFIVTNHHVIDEADEIEVVMLDGSSFRAELVGSDRKTDIALLKIQASNLVYSELIDDLSGVKPGQWVMAIGSPFQLNYSVTAGIVSAVGRNLTREEYVPFIQTDVAINPGNSGGPLFNTQGQVIGINSLIYSRSGGYQGISFAIPSDLVLEVVEQLKDNGSVRRARLGVFFQPMTKDMAEAFGMIEAVGALVSQVIAGSPAERAGIQAGDVILEFNGNPIKTANMLTKFVGFSPVGSKTPLVVFRDGSKLELEVELEYSPEELQEQKKAAQAKPKKLGTRIDILDISVRSLNAEERKKFALDYGVVVISHGSSSSSQRYFPIGSLIAQVKNTRIQSPEQLIQVIDSIPEGGLIPLLIKDVSGNSRWLSVVK